MKKQKLIYTYALEVNGYNLEGSFDVEATNYDEAYKKALNDAGASIRMPGSVCFDYDVNLLKTNAGEIFEKELNKAVDKYSIDHIDITYNEETGEFCVTFHSHNNSFACFSLEADSFFFGNNVEPEDWLKGLAEKYDVGYCL